MCDESKDEDKMSYNYKIEISTPLLTPLPEEKETFFYDIEDPTLIYLTPGTRNLSDKKIREKKKSLANAVSSASFSRDPSEPLREASFKAKAQKSDSTTLFLDNCRTNPSFQEIATNCHNTHLSFNPLSSPRPASSNRSFDALVKNIKSPEKQDHLSKTSKATNAAEEPLPTIPKINILNKISPSVVKPSPFVVKPSEKDEKTFLIPKPAFEPPSPKKTTPAMQQAVPKDPLDQKFKKVMILHEGQTMREDAAELQVALGCGKLVITPIEIAAKTICNSHPKIKQACKKAVIGATKVIREAKEIAYLALPANAALNRKLAILDDAIYKEERLGIPFETTLEYHKNVAHYVSMRVISSALVLLPPIPKLFKVPPKATPFPEISVAATANSNVIAMSSYIAHRYTSTTQKKYVSTAQRISYNFHELPPQTTQFPKIPVAANSNKLPAGADLFPEIPVTAKANSNVIAMSSYRNHRYTSSTQRKYTLATRRTAYNFHRDELVNPGLLKKVYTSDDIITIFKSINFKKAPHNKKGSSHKKLIKDGHHVSISHTDAVKKGLLKGYEKTYREAVKRDPKFSHLVLVPKEKTSVKMPSLKSKTERAISSSSKTVKHEAPKVEVESTLTAPVDPILDSWHLSGFRESRKRFESGIIERRDIRQLNKGMELITQTQKVYDGPINFEKIMEVAGKTLKTYAAKTKKEANELFIESLSMHKALVLTLKNIRDELPAIAQGRSSCQVFFVKNAQGNNLYVLKDFPALTLAKSKFAREITAYKILKDLGLENWNLPKFHKMGKYFPEKADCERGMLAMSYVDGQSLTMLKSPQEFSKAIQKIGMGLGEVHRKSYLVEKQPSLTYIQSEIEKIQRFHRECLKNLKGSEITFALEENKLTQLIENFIRNPGNTALVHGNVHLPNFIWRAETSELYAISPNSLAQAINANHHPIGCPTRDMMQAHVMLESYGAKLGRTKKEIQTSQQALYEGYNKEFSFGLHSKEAIDFYKIYFNLRNLMRITNKEKFNGKEACALIERIYADHPN